MNDLIYQTENQPLSFEDFRNENGITYWWASDVMIMLGYPNMKAFQKVLDRATKAFVSLGIPHYENILAQQREVNGDTFQDFKLTRFACYIAVMNSDPKKPEVAKTQAYFAQQTRKFELYLENNQQIERLLTREELTEGNKSLSSIAKAAKVEDYAKFTNAGYLGMYNMPNWQLAKKRKVDKDKIFDTMGRAELAANLFRVTQTEGRIIKNNIQGQANLEQAHYQVGKEVREITRKNFGQNPENLPQEKELPTVKKELKDGYKKMLKEDQKDQK